MNDDYDFPRGGRLFVQIVPETECADGYGPVITVDTGLSGHYIETPDGEANRFMVPFDSEITAEEVGRMLTASLGRSFRHQEDKR